MLGNLLPGLLQLVLQQTNKTQSISRRMARLFGSLNLETGVTQYRPSSHHELRYINREIGDKNKLENSDNENAQTYLPRIAFRCINISTLGGVLTTILGEQHVSIPRVVSKNRQHIDTNVQSQQINTTTTEASMTN